MAVGAILVNLVLRVSVVTRVEEVSMDLKVNVGIKVLLFQESKGRKEHLGILATLEFPVHQD